MSPTCEIIHRLWLEWRTCQQYGEQWAPIEDGLLTAERRQDKEDAANPCSDCASQSPRCSACRKHLERIRKAETRRAGYRANTTGIRRGKGPIFDQTTGPWEIISRDYLECSVRDAYKPPAWFIAECRPLLHQYGKQALLYLLSVQWLLNSAAGGDLEGSLIGRIAA